MSDFASIRRSSFLPALGLAVWAALFVPRPAPAADATPLELEQLFESKVRPLLATKCQRCHGDKIAEAGLRLDSRRSMLAGSDTGPVVVPGDAAKSRLVAAVRRAEGLAMPPDETLSGEEVAALEAWVTAGAPWSGPGGDGGDAPPASRAAAMEERLAAALEGHWAFKPPARHPAPELPESLDPAVRAAWSAAAIDRFVAAGLVAAGLEPSAEAAPRDLIRRLFEDLTGLPPSAAEADAFCAAAAAGPEQRDAAFRAAVDRLLASREHAEHWARKWLDIARYADTIGYAFDAQDPRYPFAWTYRDWVIDALHRDLPYDRFVTLQLAADRVEPAAPKSDLAALGFLTVGRTFLGNPHDIIDDRIDLVTRGLMGLTVACARCHDHKYEPLAATDYYALHGIFASGHIPEELPVVGESAPGPEADAFAAKLVELEAAVVAHEDAVHVRATREAIAHAADYFLEIARPTPRSADNRPPQLADGYELEQLLLDRLKRLLDGAQASHPILGAWAAATGKPDAEVGPAVAALVASWGESPAASLVNPLVLQELVSAKPADLRQLAEVYARLAARVAPAAAGGPQQEPTEPAELAEVRKLLGEQGTPLIVLRAEAMRVATRVEQTEFRRRKMDITRHNAEAAGGPPRAMVFLDNAQPVDSPVFIRGNPGKHGEKVDRRLPKLLGGAAVSRGDSGRLDLARAIVAPSNPLTARVIVNWAWTHHLGRGLVDTPGDLGLRGDPPSHPQLLDDLARRFVEEGQWSLRWLHREIVTSRTWRQTSAVSPAAADRDPDNRLFGRANRRRLEWEAWRDGMLVAAGSVAPPRLDDAAASAAAPRRGGPGVDPLSDTALHTRSIYSRLDRQDVPGILRNFDIANPDTAVHVRTRTTVPQQSLAALNAPLVVTAARMVADRVEREAAGGDDDARITSLWRAVLARDPAPDERQAAVAWLAPEAARDAAAEQPPAFGRWARLAQALLATSEFEFVD
jgi:cytochrome c553